MAHDPKQGAAPTRKLDKKRATVRISNDERDAPAATKPLDGHPFQNFENRNSLPGQQESVENRAGSDKPVTKVFGRRAKPSEGAGADTDQTQAETAAQNESDNPVTGWLVITEGAGRGCFMKIGHGMHHIGRDDSQQIVVNFGDESISRENHAKIEYDPETREFFIIKGDNRVYLNGSRVGAGGEKELTTGDEIKLGETKMRFMAFCGPDFDWQDQG